MKLVVGIVAGLIAVVAIRLLTLGRQSRSMPSNAGLVDGKLKPCDSPDHCVISTATEGRSKIDPLKAAGTPEARMKTLQQAVAQTGGVIVSQTDTYIHATYTSKRMGYVDDLELLLDPASDRVDVRSCSRVGKLDLGANRNRVEALRNALGK